MMCEPKAGFADREQRQQGRYRGHIAALTMPSFYSYLLKKALSV
jgi:hypothetical protein